MPTTTTPILPLTPTTSKLILYVLPDKKNPHKALTLFGTAKNAQNHFVTGPQIALWGLYWPNNAVKTRDELALQIGRTILDEAGV
jgi:hypothetical protein